MDLDDISDIIAERALTLLDESGNARKVLVRLGRPQQSPDGDEYSCLVQLVGLGDGQPDRIYGVDAFQALQLTLKYISFRLHHYRKESNLTLYCWEQGDDMGFPDEYPQQK